MTNSYGMDGLTRDVSWEFRLVWACGHGFPPIQGRVQDLLRLFRAAHRPRPSSHGPFIQPMVRPKEFAPFPSSHAEKNVETFYWYYTATLQSMTNASVSKQSKLIWNSPIEVKGLGIAGNVFPKQQFWQGQNLWSLSLVLITDWRVVTLFELTFSRGK